MNEKRVANSNTVKISLSVLRWALERSGRSSAAARKFPKLNEWLKGESMPTFRQLEELAKTTATPLGYFFLSNPPLEKLPIPYFRTLEDHPMDRLSPELIDTVQSVGIMAQYKNIAVFGGPKYQGGYEIGAAYMIRW